MQQATRSLVFVAGAFVILLAVAGWAFGVFLETRDHPNRGIVAGADGPTRIELERNPAGQYLVPGRINGADVMFLVDTGATHVAVPEATAAEIGLRRGPEIAVMTAAGRTTAWRTEIDRIDVGGIRQRRIRASIVPAMSSDYVLLGMTFLRHVDFSHRGDRLIIEPAS